MLFHRTDGRKHLETLGRWDENDQGGTLTVRDAIIRADKRIKEIASGVDKKGNEVDHRPKRTRRLLDGDKPGVLDVSGLLDHFVERYVRNDAKLRSADAVKGILDRLVKPRIGKLGIYDIRRSNVVGMLDEIADENGLVMADRTLAHVRKAFNWWATRDDNFHPPIVKGMSRTKAKEQARKRILADDEIRDVWEALKRSPDCAELLRAIP